MTCLKAGFSVSGSSNFFVKNREKGSFTVCSSFGTLRYNDSNLNRFLGKSLDFPDRKRVPNLGSVHAQTLVSFSKSVRWWEKSLAPNMIEINSAQELVDYLLNAGDKLVIVDFYSPGCGGCKALHPKICQLAESNPDAIILKVNYEEHKAMCYALHVHVLPFFRFYRGAQGRVCSFSCTNATIKKFKDALAKHGTDRCSLGPTKGLDESELMALAEIDQIPIDLVPKKENVEELVPKEAVKTIASLDKDELKKMRAKEGNAMAMA